MIWGWLKGSFLLRDLDRNLAVAGIILAILMIVVGVTHYKIIHLLVGSLVLISCLLWLVIRKTHTFEFHFSESQIQTTFWAICFFGLYTLSVFSVYFRPNLYERPLLYFILTLLMVGVIACEIFTSSRRHAHLILIQILLLGVSIAWSQLLIFPTLLGIDPWYHSALTNRILAEGFIPEGFSYSKLPLLHLTIAATSLCAALPYKFAAMASTGLGQIICNTMFAFLIANRLFKDQRVGLLAALMVVVANGHIFMSFASIPNGFAGAFIPIVVYLMLFLMVSNTHKFNPLIIGITMIVPMVAVILTHSITALCMAILLFVAWGILRIYRVIYSRTGNYIGLLIPCSFIVTMFSWWTYASGHARTLGQIIEWGFSIDYFSTIPSEYLKYAIPVPLGEQIFNSLGIYLFFAIALIGIFYMVSRRGNISTFFIAALAITPLAISFLTSISGDITVLVARWWYFAQILLSVPLAVAIYLIVTWKAQGALFRYCFALGFIIILTILMIMSTQANFDNHILSPVTGSTSAYTQSEMVASDFFAANAIGVISSDRNYCTNPSSSVFSHAYGISPERLHCLDDSLVFGEFDHDGSIKVIRSKWFHEPFKRGGLSFQIRQDLNEYLSNLGFNKVYNNPMMSGYIG